MYEEMIATSSTANSNGRIMVSDWQIDFNERREKLNAIMCPD